MAGSSYGESHSQSTSDTTSYIPNYAEEPILMSIAQYAAGMAPQVYKWGMDTYNKNQDNIDAVMRDALQYASPQRIAVDMGMAEAGVQQAGEAGRQSAIRDLESYGIDPSSGRYAALDQANRVMTAASAAGAGNQQRMADQAAGNAMRQQSISASLQNTASGIAASNAANAWANTGMSLKYPPLAHDTHAQSTTNSFNSSVSGDGGGGGGSKGGEKPPPQQGGGGGGGGKEPSQKAAKPPAPAKPQPKGPQKPKEDQEKKEPEEAKPGDDSGYNRPSLYDPTAPELGQAPPPEAYGNTSLYDPTAPELGQAPQPDAYGNTSLYDPTRPELGEVPQPDAYGYGSLYNPNAPAEPDLTPAPANTNPYGPSDWPTETDDGGGNSSALTAPNFASTYRPGETPFTEPDPFSSPDLPANDLYATTDFSGANQYANLRLGNQLTDTNEYPQVASSDDQYVPNFNNIDTTDYGSSYDYGSQYDPGAAYQTPSYDYGSMYDPSQYQTDFGQDQYFNPGDYQFNDPYANQDFGSDQYFNPDDYQFNDPYANYDFGQDNLQDYTDYGDDYDYSQVPGFDESGYDYTDSSDDFSDYTDYGDDYDYSQVPGFDESGYDYTAPEDGGDYAEGGPVKMQRGGMMMRRPPGRRPPPMGRPPMRRGPPPTGYGGRGMTAQPGMAPNPMRRGPPRPQVPGPGGGPMLPPPPTPMFMNPRQPAGNGPPMMARGGQVRPPTTGGFVSRDLSPSNGARTDDVAAQLNAGEFVIPRDVAAWKGKEFFYKLIEQARKLREGGGQQSQQQPSRTGYDQ